MRMVALRMMAMLWRCYTDGVKVDELCDCDGDADDNVDVHDDHDVGDGTIMIMTMTMRSMLVWMLQDGTMIVIMTIVMTLSSSNHTFLLRTLFYVPLLDIQGFPGYVGVPAVLIHGLPARPTHADGRGEGDICQIFFFCSLTLNGFEPCRLVWYDRHCC